MNFDQTSEEETYEENVIDLPSEGLYILQQKTSFTARNLQDFLSVPQISVGKKDDRTTVSNVQFGKNYDIRGGVTDEFFRLMEECRREGQVMHLTERQYSSSITHSGIMLDFDIYQSVSARQFNQHWLGRLSGTIAGILANILRFEEKLEGNIYAIAKPAPVLLDGTKYKDGMHILIPDILIQKGVKQHLLYEKLLGSPGFASLFKGWSLDCSLREMLDIGAVRNPVFFFGSCKPSRDGKRPVPYELIHHTSFSVFEYESPSCVTMPISEWIEEGHNLCYELSLSFSLDYLNGKATYHKKRIYEHKSDFDAVLQMKAVDTAPIKIDEEDALSILLASSIRAKSLKTVLELLDTSYVTEYDKWFKVLCAIAHTSPSYKEIAKWFSQRVPEAYDSAGFKRVWSQVCQQRSNNPLTEKSIYYWARTCSPEKFKEVRIRNQVDMATNFVIKNEGRLTHAYVAEMLRDIAGEYFVTDVMKNAAGHTAYVWYEFVLKLGNGNIEPAEVYKWRQEFKPQTLYLMIPNQVAEIFYEVEKRLENQKNNTQDEGLAKFYELTKKELKKSITSLGQTGVQNGIITQAEFRFRDRSFAENLDNYPLHLGVSNGIVSLGAEPQLIKSFHELKISKYTKVAYRPFNRDDPYIRQMLNSIYDIYLENDVFMYKMFYYSTACHGEAKDAKIMLSNGGGSNGKTTCAYFTRMVLGDHFSTDLKPGLLTSVAEQPQQANEAVMAMQGKRFCYFDEFSEHDALNMARVKSLVGPVRVSNRGLYGKMVPIENTSTMEAISNFPFNIDTCDHGTWRRIMQYTFKVKFTDNPDPNNPYERKNNRDVLKKWPKDPDYASAWLSILVYFYQRLCIQYGGDINNVPCPTIIRETEIFRNKQDMVNCYISLNIVYSKGAEAINIETLMFKYREWFTSRTKRVPPSHDSLRTMFESSRIGKFIGRHGGADIVLVDHRIRASLDERLAPGEISLSVSDTQAEDNIHGRLFIPEDFGM